MKSLFLIIGLCFAFFISNADVLILKSGLTFSGEVKKIKNCEIVFKVESEKFIIPSSDVFKIEFEKNNTKVYKKYLNSLNDTTDNCLKGKIDAQNYHGKKVGHFFLGFFFGPVAVLGTLLSSPTPFKSEKTLLMSENKKIFSDVKYLQCYKKTAKKNLLLMETFGFCSFVLFYVIGTN